MQGLKPSLVSCALLLLASSAASAADKNLLLNGGFIQLLNGSNTERWSDAQKQAVPTFVKLAEKVSVELGMNTFVVQNLRYTEANGSSYTYIFPDTAKRDLVAELLNYAATKNRGGAQKVSAYLGLDYSESLIGNIGGKSESEISNLFSEQSKQDILLAEEISKRFKQSFQGWYLTIEIPNFKSWKGSSIVTSFHDYVKAVSKRCHELSPNAKIAISPYFNIAELNAADTAEVINKIVGGTEVNVLMIQDGVVYMPGSRAAKLAKVQEYFEAIKAKNPKCEIIADVEIGTASTATMLGEQLCTLKPIAPAKRLAFDLYHYMNPLTPDESTSDGQALVRAPLATRKSLYDAYRAATGKTNYPCQ